MDLLYDLISVDTMKSLLSFTEMFFVIYLLIIIE